MCHSPGGHHQFSLSLPSPQGSPHPVHGPVLHVSPPGPSTPVPVMPQQGWAPGSHSPALPWLCRDRPTHGPKSQPSLSLSLSPERCLMPRTAAALLLVGEMGKALAARSSHHSPWDSPGSCCPPQCPKR